MQSPVVAAAFYVGCLAVWVGHGALRRWVTKPVGHPLPVLLALLAPVALTVSLGRWLFALAAGFWQSAAIVGACLLTLLLSLVLNVWIAQIPFLKDREESKASHDASDDPAAGTWLPEGEWFSMPNGLKVRSVWSGEIGMGGPQVFTHIFSNGLEFCGGAMELTLSPDGRYAACADMRGHFPFVLADLEQGIVRSGLSNDEGRAVFEAGSDLARVCHLLQDGKAEQYVRVHGLWVSPQAHVPPENRVLCDRQGRPRLQLQRIFDEKEMRASGNPGNYLRSGADYAVVLDGETLPIRTRAPDGIVWSDEGDMVLIPCSDRGGEASSPGTHWCWRGNGESGWVSPCTWDSKSSLPSGGGVFVTAIDRHGYWLGFHMSRPSESAYPHRSLASAFPRFYTCGEPRQWIVGADERGRLVIRDIEAPQGGLRVRQPWTAGEEAERDGLVESSPGADPTRVALFVPCPRPGDSGLLRYRVEVNGARADDVELFHLWSDCGRYLALQPHCGWGQLPDSFFVLDTVSGQRLETAFRGCGLQLVAWVAGELQVGVVAGSVASDDYSFDPFEAIEPPPPPTGDGLLRHQWLLTESQRFRVDPAGPMLVGPLPKHVEVTLPPYPNAAFDFNYPAPGGSRSVFVFGARNEFQDDDDRAQECRYQARAITSDGICLEGLGVGMIWSDDARYLIVTTRVPREHPDYDDTAWKARVIDCERHLVYPGVPLGCMPIFERFADDRIHYRRVRADWWREDIDTFPDRLEMRVLMQGWPEPMVQYEGLWLPNYCAWSPRWREAYERIYGERAALHPG